jgi:hypothetical protein
MFSQIVYKHPCECGFKYSSTNPVYSCLNCGGNVTPKEYEKPLAMIYEVPVDQGIRTQTKSTITFQCPHCKRVAQVHNGTSYRCICEGPDPAELWAEAHKYAPANKDNWSEKAARFWYNGWIKKIPKFGCGCEDHWAALTSNNPPQFESPLAFFTWFWARHNDVSTNQSLKPTLTLEEAFALWWPDQQNLSQT